MTRPGLGLESSLLVLRLLGIVVLVLVPRGAPGPLKVRRCRETQFRKGKLCGGSGGAGMTLRPVSDVSSSSSIVLPVAVLLLLSSSPVGLCQVTRRRLTWQGMQTGAMTRTTWQLALA